MNNALERNWMFWVLFSTFIVIAADYLTGPAIQFPFVFVFPVVLASWYGGKAWGFVLAFLLSCVRIVLHHVWDGSSSVPNTVVNAAIRLGVLGGIAFLTAHTAALTREIKILKGILPTCSNCKKIRSEDGSWEQMEVYITKHSEAKFSHGLCDECAKNLYPAYFKKTRRE